MQITRGSDFQDVRDAVRALCAEFPSEYHRRIDEERGYPEEFVDALTKAGWMAALIPEDYGGSGLGLTEASVIMEEINRSGGNSGACHGQMYNMNTLIRHGSEEQRWKYLPRIASGELRLQSMGVTEPTTGTDTTKIKTTAVKKGDRYVINGQKVWISRIQHSDLMILLARTTPLDQVKKKSEGMSIFIVDIKEAMAKGMSVRPILNMVNHETNELFFDNLEIPAENLIGEEGQGFKYILTGLNAERTLIAADVVIQNLKPGALDRMGFGPETLRRTYPRVIVCSISGYGETGPLADRKAYDLLIQAESGLSSVTGGPDAPARVGISVVDIATGATAYSAILEALLARQTTGQGADIRVSMFDVMADWLTVPLLQQEGGKPPKRIGLAHVSIAPYGVFQTRDCKDILISIQNDREWIRFCADFLRRPELGSDARFARNVDRVANRAATDALVAAAFGGMTEQEARPRLSTADVAFASVNDMAALSRHPHLRRITVGTAAGEVSFPAPAPVFVDSHRCYGAVPSLGEHDPARLPPGNQKAGVV